MAFLTGGQMRGYSGGTQETKLLVGLFLACGVLNFLGTSNEILAGITIIGLVVCWFGPRFFLTKTDETDKADDTPHNLYERSNKH